MPINKNALMNANASEGAKVRPTDRIPIRKTGRLRTTAEANGNASAGRQPPNLFRNQNRDGAYASENKSAEIISEVIVTPLISSAPSFSPPNTVNASSIIASARSQDANDIDRSFISKLCESRHEVEIWNCELRLYPRLVLKLSQ